MGLKTVTASLIMSFSVATANATDDYITRLDETVNNAETFHLKKEAEIDSLKTELNTCDDYEKKYYIAMDIYRAYQTYNLDSALIYVKTSLALAEQLGDKERLMDTQIARAYLYLYTSMYMESHDIFTSLDIRGCSQWLQRAYYHLGMNLYQNLSTYSADYQLKDEYQRAYYNYRDSALIYTPEDDVRTAERYADIGDYNKALGLLSDGLQDGLTDREAGIKYYIISEVYAKQGNRQLQKKYLAMAADADIHNGVREYIALRKLALILYEEGDIERAYRYLHRCVDDANACNVRLRIIEVSSIIPLIDSAYSAKEARDKRSLTVLLACVFLLACLLIGSVLYIRRRNSSLSKAKQELQSLNEELKQNYRAQEKLSQELKAVNDDLTDVNQKQKSLNETLVTANRIKEEYIMRFMTLCLEYIAKMENYRNSLVKVASSRNFDKLFAAIKSSQYVTKEINEFYRNFDETFLTLFPDFVKKFNELLIPQEQFRIAPGDGLNTEMRIYALMRLGISDGQRVSQFLRCSSSTLYNYRTKMRNRAKDRSTFETDVLNIN